MKILIVGAGKVGYTCTAQLSREGHDITLVDVRPDVLEKAQGAYDVIAVTGNGASLSTLQAAGITDMDVLIAVSNADEVNLLACITAKHLNPHINCIARIRDPEYVAQAYEMRDEFGLYLVVNPERQAAHEIFQLLKLPGSLTRETFAKARMEMIELRVAEGSLLCGKRLSELENAVHTRVLVCAIERHGEVIIPRGDASLMAGDRISVTGSSNNLHQMLVHLGIIRKNIRHVLIAGGGRISYYLASELGRSGMTANIIESDASRCEELADLLPAATVVHGDASSQSFLETEDLTDYDAVVSCTGIDELNIVISMYASMCHVPLTITKLGRGDSSRILDSLPVGPTVCPKDLCTTHIVRYVRAMEHSSGLSALSVHKIASGNAEVLEFVVDENTKHIGEKLKDMPIQKNVLIASISSGRTTEIAHGDMTFHAGDTVVIVAASDHVIGTLNDIFGE